MEEKNKEVITIIAAVIIIILVAYLGLSPAVLSLKESNYTVATQGQDLKRAQENLDNLKNLQITIETKTNEVKALTSSFPSEVNSQDLITTLEAIANRNGMQLTSVAPLETAASEGEESGKLELGQGDFDIVVRGSFQGLQKFMTDLESNRRPTNVTALTIAKENSSDGGSILNTTISLTAYYSQI
ncbi:type 4a pilus biogenesis protein PilO [Patescibacteria group bacterium]|nr:type 4a pilus biogenesis protein PilO [Patescibacteria group bacterium]